MHTLGCSKVQENLCIDSIEFWHDSDYYQTPIIIDGNHCEKTGSCPFTLTHFFYNGGYSQGGSQEGSQGGSDAKEL